MKFLKQTSFIFIFFLTAIVFTMATQQRNKQSIEKKTINNSDNLLKQINSWQDNFWTITKRNMDNVICIAECDKKSLNKNLLELKQLENSIEKTINKKNEYLKQLKEPTYQEKQPETQFEMNMSAGEKLEKTDKILNKVYKNIKSTIKKEDFNKLKINQRLWLKELEKYSNNLEQNIGGSIAPMIINQQINSAKYFRTLLLISYLENCNKQ